MRRTTLDVVYANVGASTRVATRDGRRVPGHLANYVPVKVVCNSHEPVRIVRELRGVDGNGRELLDRDAWTCNDHGNEEAERSEARGEHYAKLNGQAKISEMESERERRAGDGRRYICTMSRLGAP